MTVDVPELSLVLLVGPSGCGKSTFAARHFLPTEIISSDRCRGLVCDDETDQSASEDAFDLLRKVASLRLRRGKLTVIDATSVQQSARAQLLRLAAEYHVPAAAIVFTLPAETCIERNRGRPDRQFGEHVVRNQLRELKRGIRSLDREGFKSISYLHSQEEVDAAVVERSRLWPNLRHEAGPFDIVGDVHGCFDEVVALLGLLGYEITELNEPAEESHVIPGSLRPTSRWIPTVYYRIVAPESRRLIFLGDLVDRGPASPQVLKLVMSAVAQGLAIVVPGNHDDKLVRYLRGKKVKIAHGLQETLDQLEAEAPEFREGVKRFLDALTSHFVLDGGTLVVAHAGMKESMQGRASARVRDFALYGETTGETDEFGLPVRFNWAGEYRGVADVVYGHTPVPNAEWLNKTINIDTGCVFGGRLTALRYPERELVSVPALITYAQSAKPIDFESSALSAQQSHDEVIDLTDVMGRRVVHTRLRGNVMIREEHASAGLEAMSRFAANPKWLVYLPPTMSPTETTPVEGLLEHPAEAFQYFASNATERVVCEEKHMGSRAVVIACRDADAARNAFGIETGEIGTVFTRTGRRFFGDAALEAEFLSRVSRAIDSCGLFTELDTDWVILDAELLPWSAKAQDLLTKQYAPAGAAATSALSFALANALPPTDIDSDVAALRARLTARAHAARAYVDAYSRYCWPVEGLNDLKLAPFHVLASNGVCHTDKDHGWHMESLRRLCESDPDLLLATPYRTVDLRDEASVGAAIAWWTELTASGGEGMVVKPYGFVAADASGRLLQPAIKCRGKEYLRIIYGPEYDLHENLSRLRKRGLSAKRSLALREFALGIEGLERFVRGEPLRRVHECAFAVLALESEPVDPRL